jgi:hypothetical protein
MGDVSDGGSAVSKALKLVDPCSEDLAVGSERQGKQILAGEIGWFGQVRLRNIHWRRSKDLLHTYPGMVQT